MRDRVSLPEHRDEGWEMDGAAGMETLVLLARDAPLPDDFDLASRLADLPPTQLAHERLIVWFDQGETRRHDRLRAHLPVALFAVLAVADAEEVTTEFEDLLKQRAAILMEVRTAQQANDPERFLTAAEKHAAVERQILARLKQDGAAPEKLEQTHDRLISVLKFLAGQYGPREDFDAAEQTLNEIRELAGARWGEQQWQLADARRAVDDLRRLREMTPRQRQDVREAQRLNGLVMRLRHAGRFAQALEPANQTLKLREQTVGEEHPDYPFSLNNLAHLY